MFKWLKNEVKCYRAFRIAKTAAQMDRIWDRILKDEDAEGYTALEYKVPHLRLVK